MNSTPSAPPWRSLWMWARRAAHSGQWGGSTRLGDDCCKVSGALVGAPYRAGCACPEGVRGVAPRASATYHRTFEEPS